MAAVIPAVTQLSNRIIRILGCNPGPMTLQGTNTYLIGTGKKYVFNYLYSCKNDLLLVFIYLYISSRILLDTGDKDISEYQKNLSEVIKSEQVNIEHIVVTHWHHDHIGGIENIFGTIASKYNMTTL